MLVLGIESTAHSFGVGIVEERGGKARILANELSKYPSTRAGYIPRKLVEFHSKHFLKTIEDALEKADVGLNELSAVAYSYGPGIGHCLHFGYIVAKTLSAQLRIPLIPVNHAIAHVEIGKFCGKMKDPLTVYVSGGNTQVLALHAEKGEKRYHVFGETLDIGLGNFLDQVGRKLGLNPPDAVGVLTEAAKGKRFIQLPYTVKGMNTAFSGLLTAVEKMKGKESNVDLCYSAQETSFAMLVEATERCLCHTRNEEVLLCGGNARNKRLQEMLELMSKEQGARFCATPPDLSGDQGAMIAYTGLLMLKHNAVPKNTEPNQKVRIDSQEISW